MAFPNLNHGTVLTKLRSWSICKSKQIAICINPLIQTHAGPDPPKT